jgi:ornithine decarboxylase
MTSSFHDIPSIIQSLKPAHAILCFSPQKITENVKKFQDGFPGTVAWAVKSNPDIAIIKAIVAAGITQFDVASADEIKRIAKYCPNGIMHFNHPVKPKEEIKFAYFKAGIKNFVIDDFAEFEKFETVLTKGGVKDFSDITLLIRFLNPQKNGSKNYDFGKKFGATPDIAIQLIKAAIKKGYQVGLTFHPGSQNETLDVYDTMINLGKDIAQKALIGTNQKLVRFNIGGGFPCFYPDRVMPTLDAQFAMIKKMIKDKSYELICEPGRALTSNSISVLARVNLRRASDNRIYLNDGFYGSFMELPFVDFMPPHRVYTSRGKLREYKQSDLKSFQVWGPTCDSLDKLPKPLKLPSTIETGDYIEFGLMGAYSNATATRFNGITPAKMVIVDHLNDWNKP